MTAEDSALPIELGKPVPATKLTLVKREPKILPEGPRKSIPVQSLSILIFVSGVAFLLRLILAIYFLLHYGAARVYGSFESCRIAASIVAGHGFSSPYAVTSGPTAWLPPVYPYLVAAVFKVLGVYSLPSLWCLILLNIVCATLTTALIYRIGERCCSSMAGFVASMLWAIELTTVAFAVRIWESNLSALLVALSVVFYLKLLESPGWKRGWILYGLFWAVAGLTNTALLALMPLSVAALLYRRTRDAGRYALLALVVFAAALLPWCVRNYVVFHQVIPIRSNFGPNLWYGNHPGVTGAADQSLDPTRNPQELRAYVAGGEAAYCASRQQMAFDFIRQHPAKFARLTWARIVFFWTGPPAGLRISICALTLAVLGILLMIGQHKAMVAVPFVAALVLFPLPYYLTHAETFYRYPIQPILVLLIAYACVEVWALSGEISSRWRSWPPTARRIGPEPDAVAERPR